MSRETIVENQTAAASALGVDPEVVKRARRMNCPACLTGGRYNIPKLRKWIAENADALKAAGDALSLRDKKLNEEIRKLKIANDVAAGLSVPIDWMIERDARLAALFKPSMYSKLVDEAPADMTNDVSTNRALLRNIADRLFLEIVSWQKESIIPKQQ